MKSIYDLALDFKRKHPGGIAWRLKEHCKVVEKHINPGEEVLFVFAGQKNTKFYEPFFSCVVVLTNKRILIGQKRVVWGYFLSSITPDLYNDLFIYNGLLWGTITIDTVKEVAKGKIYAVFGCTGDRDRIKRPVMMQLVTNLCDYAIITSDDLHNESFEHILADMLENNINTNYEVISNRPEAIKKGISLLNKSDVLLILGKGHEEVMIVKDLKIPMNDKKIVLDILKQEVR